MKPSTYPILATSLALLGACATNQTALDQANHTVQLIAQLELKVGEFQQLTNAAQQARIASMRTQQSTMALLGRDAQSDAQAGRSAGDVQGAQLFAQLVADAKGVAGANVDVQAAQSAYAKTLQALLTPLGGNQDALDAAHTAAAELGKELSPDVRREELFSFVEAVSKAQQDAKKKLDAAQADAAKADKAGAAASKQAAASAPAVAPPPPNKP